METLDKTQTTVDSIETTVIRTQGNVADLQTDIPTLIARKSDEQLQRIDKIEQSFQLVETTLRTLQSRLEDFGQAQGTHVEQQGARHCLIATEMQAISDVLKTVNVVLENVHTLIKELQPAPRPQILSAPETDDKKAS
jgi:hypothetical protein